MRPWRNRSCRILNWCRFVGIDLGREAAPDATTLFKFRRLLETHKLGETLFAEVGRLLQASGMKFKSGTINSRTLLGAMPP